MQLRQKFFIILTLITAVPLLVLLFGVVDRMETELSKRTEKELLVTLDKMADELTLILENQKAIARGLAYVPVVRSFAAIAGKPVGKGVSAAVYQRRADELEAFFLNYQRMVPSIQALRFIDTNGKTLVKVKEGKPIEAKMKDVAFNRLYIADQSNKSFFKHTMDENKDVVMSDFELGQVTTDADFCPAMVRYSAQIKDEVESLEGMLVVNMWGTRLDSTIEASLGGYPGNAYVVEISDDKDRDGIYLYNRDPKKRFGNQLQSKYRFSNEFSPQQWQQMRDTKMHGSLFLQDGRMIFYRILSPYKSRPATKWLLLIQTDRKTLFAPIDKVRKSIWLMIGLLLIVSLLVSVWVAGQLARPVNALAQVITDYADGDYAARYQEKRKDEIGAAGSAFNYLASSLEEAENERARAEKSARQSERLASVGQLAAGIGHEINNPLMNIMSLAALLEQAVKHDQQALTDLELLQEEGRRCARIVQGILSFARESKPDYHEFDMSQLVEDTLKLLRHRIQNAEIKMATELKPDLCIVGDSNQLQQVLVNVILNAVQASPRNSKIEIKSYKDIDYVAVEIIDTGTGIAKDNLTKVFDPFFTTKSEGEGTGLGLSVSYGIVKHHGGTIHLENLNGAGLRVVILLPFQVPAENVQNKEEREVNHVG
ncbi:MAG: HAMP domain-containing protein [Gammaproteobacteria bacterium]|nr:HAMP domain-containing protein [Gammaproteobacteria bacterium]